MDRGVTIENPYASVTIPRAQLKDSFLRYYLGEDQAPGTVFYNPSSLPTYTAAPEKARPEAAEQQQGAAYSSQIPTRESWARPFNPYASLKMPSGTSPEPFHWKSHQEAALNGSGGGGGDRGNPSCCCCCCCRRQKCSPCCKRCCCVVS